MKRLIAAAAIIAVVTALCITGNAFVKHICDQTEDMVNKCINIYSSGDFEAAEDRARQLRKTWDTQQRKLALFANHSLLDGITSETTAMPYFANGEEECDFYASGAKILQLLTQIKREQKISYDTFY